jgi:cytochrome P450
VAVNVWVAHANREVFGEDAEAFRPERWMEADWNGEGAGEMEWYFFTVC